MLITHPDYHEDNKKKAKYLEVIVEELKKKKLLTDDMSFGPLKYMGVCKLVCIYNWRFLSSATTSPSNYTFTNFYRKDKMKMENHTFIDALTCGMLDLL
jgi:hypothetical protein